MKALVTGGAGFIGSNLVKRLVKKVVKLYPWIIILLVLKIII